MEKLFVTYEIAKQLKEKGFNEPCFAHYTGNKVLFRVRGQEMWPLIQLSSLKEGAIHIPTPLYQQVTDWLREKHNIEIYCPNYYKNSKGYKPEYECRVNGKQLSREYSSNSSVILFPTYYEAMDLSIEEALKLI